LRAVPPLHVSFFDPFSVFFYALCSSRFSGFFPRLRSCGTLFRNCLVSFFLELDNGWRCSYRDGCRDRVGGTTAPCQQHKKQ
jgi:hypothetical protein